MSAQDNKTRRPTKRPLVKSEQGFATRKSVSTSTKRVSDQERAEVAQRRSARSTAKESVRPSAKKSVHVAPKATPREMLESLLRTSIVARVIACLLVVLVVGGIGDFLANLGRAYPGVSIEGVDVSGQNADEIKASLESSLKQRVEQGMVTIYATEEARDNINNAIGQMQNEAIAEQLSIEEARARHELWTATAASLGASAQIDAAVDKALNYARGLENLPARISAAFGGADLQLDVAYDEFAITNLIDEINLAIGDARYDATIAVEDGYASVVEGHDGQLINRKAFKESLSRCLVESGSEGGFVAYAVHAPMRITHDMAQEAANMVNAQLSRALTFTYNEQPWTPDRALVGSWIDASIVGDETVELEISIDSERATPDILSGVFAAIDTQSWSVSFESTSEGIMVRTEGNGTLPDLVGAARELDEAMFKSGGANDDIAIDIATTEAPESLSFEQARELGLVSIIGTYTTEYSDYAGTENRNHNIHRAAEILDNTIAKANGGYWSFNDNSGDTNDATGFVAAGSIVNGEYVDSIGGGICQVATTIFNAVFEAGLDIVDRMNHTLYIASYPTGRDAAVSYPDLDLVWQNNLPNDVLLKLSYTDTSITATLYSMATGYRVESREGEWFEGSKYKTKFETDEELGKGVSYTKTVGEDGRSITVYRTVFDHNGETVLEDSFLSVYSPKDEVIVVGPDTDTKGMSREEREAKNE